MPKNGNGKRPRNGSKKDEDDLSKKERKQVQAMINKPQEVRYCPNWFTYDDWGTPAGYLQLTRTNPVTLPGIIPNANDACNVLGFQTGYYLNSESVQINTDIGAGTMVPLGGYGMEQGVDATNIIGDYSYLQSVKLDLQITALPWNTNNGDVYSAGMSGLQFRVIHAQAKQIQSGITPSYSNAFFWDRTHDKVGLTMVGTCKEIMSDFHLNTDQFIIHHDIKFRLTQPQHPSGLDTLIIQQNDQPTATFQTFSNVAFQGAATNPTYPCSKSVSFWLPKIKKKIRFSDLDNGSTNAFEPTNANFVNMVFVICCRVNQQQVIPTNNSCSRAWSVKAAGETRYKDA